MWKTINSPIVIAIIIIASLFILKSQMKPTLATEIRGVYKELNAILKDGATDAEKNKAIQKFAQEIAKQIKEGFSAGFKSGEDKKEDKDKIYIETKKKIKINGIKFVKAKWKGREAFIFVIKNNSDKYIKSLKLNYEFYKNGELIDSENKWISNIKILEPNQGVAHSADRQFPQGTKEEEYDNYKSDEVRIQITSFDIKEMK
ncbi:MAG: hypothetical protein KAI63_05520 [Planctomycetes bacterium]|nr:hypothetical protein [Planctomycetota bacterium]